MIQRIQSIFLLLSGIAFFSLFALPFATSTVSIPVLMSDMIYDVQDSPILMTLCVVGGLVCIVAIFLFNNRVLQLRLSYLATVFSILLPLVAFLLIYNEQTSDLNYEKINDGLGLYLPFISLVFSILAARFISKDENTVRSMDRLR
jgi:FtsH-binding integral membrane protein